MVSQKNAKGLWATVHTEKFRGWRKTGRNIFTAMLILFTGWVPVLAQTAQTTPTIKKQNTPKTAPKMTKEAVQPAEPSTGPVAPASESTGSGISYFASLTFPVVLPMGDLAQALAPGYGLSLGGGVSLTNTSFLSPLRNLRLGLDAGAFAGYQMHSAKGAAEGRGSAIPLGGLLRLNYLSGVWLPYLQLSGGTAYTSVERQANATHSAKTNAAWQGYVAPGLGLRYALSQHWQLSFLSTYELFFEPQVASFLNLRLGVDYAF